MSLSSDATKKCGRADRVLCHYDCSLRGLPPAFFLRLACSRRNVLRAALGNLLAALASKGYGGWVFGGFLWLAFCHAPRVNYERVLWEGSVNALLPHYPTLPEM